MDEICVYEEHVEREQAIMCKLTTEVLPGLVSNLSANMGGFVSVYKDLRELQIERMAELKKLEMDKEKGLEKFRALVDKTQGRLSETLQMIRDFQGKIISIGVSSPEEVRSQELLLQAMQSCQMQYLTEMQALINL